MRIDPAGDRAMASAASCATTPPRHSRQPWRALLAEVAQLAAGQGELLRHNERSWVSVTFSGTRHALTLAFTGIDAVAAGEAFIAALPEYQFALPGQLVADAAVVAANHALLPEPRLTVEAELLLVEDA